MISGPITCCIRYKIAPGKRSDFEQYALVWKGIIERVGGTYLGCFIPGNEPPDGSHFSFPDVGSRGPDDIATVIFSFRDIATYDRYRREAHFDPECGPITDFYNKTQCFTSYERTFVTQTDR
jgi:hypothetical protein